MSEPQMEVLRGVSASIPMPTKLRIGDPLYFEIYENEPKKLERLTYAKTFRRPTWLGRVNLMEGLVHYATLNGEIDTMLDSCVRFYFAPTQELLDLYLDGKHYSFQKEKVIDIGVDTARYIIGYNKNETLIQTDADGFWGYVTEFSKGNKLEGVEVFLSLGENYDFESAKELLESLIECKFELEF
ncbi:MAG: hypothetical protein IJ085_02490 [Turicibacter sp.]|nr:hypothetical protein [Turicibacter sp.]